MTTSQAGGKITGHLALTCTGQVALQVGDHVHVSGNYTVAKADGTKAVLGTVSVANVKRGSDGAWPVADAGGDVTVEARGFAVYNATAGAAISAGQEVGIGSANTLVPAGSNVATCGIALTTASGNGVKFDYLSR